MASQSHSQAERQFSAFARPRGDEALGIAGPLVEIHERLIKPRRGVRTLQAVRVLSHAEAAQLHYELGEALRAFDLAKALARDVVEAFVAEGCGGVTSASSSEAVGQQETASSSAAVGQQERPRAYNGQYPIRDHGTLADHGFLNAEEPC
jgi:hypothetical protein